ncbi:hypothetical protein [Sorangium sp. So ce861]|uniref:hypothetical protein n=1 Tax=Sorangium sp. So ce861 TaxID=3133323 RepID=UPI003F643746
MKSGAMQAVQARVLEVFLCGGEVILDVEESPDDCPIRLVGESDYGGLGQLCRVVRPVDYARLSSWLYRQVWLALVMSRFPVVPLRLEWTPEMLFGTPESALGMLRETGADRLVVSYFDSDAWLLAVAG